MTTPTSENRTVPTATFRDTYCGDVHVELVRTGKSYRWASRTHCINPGYRGVATVERAIAIARRDRRFSNVRAAQ
jgi:hypothetical protein